MSGVGPRGGLEGRDPPRRRDLRPGGERRVRAAWEEGPGAALRLAGRLFGLASGLRNLAYDAGLAAPAEAGVPVLSVGGLAVGGSGKTPVAARAVRWARKAGSNPAVATHGHPDELALHRRMNPGVPVFGDRDRVRAAREASRAGGEPVVLDDGFQHRRLARDLDWVVVDEERLAGSGPWRLVPAGPGREAWSSLTRADGIVLSRREGAARTTADAGGSLTGRVGRQFPSAVVARCELRPGPLAPANDAARERRDARPRVAFASIMKGEDVLQALRRRRPELEHEFLFPDHHPLTDARVEEMIRLAGDGGLVGTRKDVVKVQERVGERTPLWRAGEEIAWTHGRDDLRRQLLGLLASP